MFCVCVCARDKPTVSGKAERTYFPAASRWQHTEGYIHRERMLGAETFRSVIKLPSSHDEVSKMCRKTSWGALTFMTFMHIWVS